MNIEKTVNALKENGMNVVFVNTAEQARQEVKKLLNKGSTTASGGSVTLKETGIYDLITCEDYNYIDRFKAKTEEEKAEMFSKISKCDYYFCSANAITENGELVNVDGFSNRVSALCFGPKNVIVVAGKNKLVKDVKEGFLRIKKIAAPKNCVRLNKNTPCAKTGKCISLSETELPDICGGCKSPDRICRNYVVCGPQAVKGRITVIICMEDLGY